jgi:hypothetical protein
MIKDFSMRRWDVLFLVANGFLLVTGAHYLLADEASSPAAGRNLVVAGMAILFLILCIGLLRRRRQGQKESGGRGKSDTMGRPSV